MLDQINYPVYDVSIINAQKLYLNTSDYLKKYFSGDSDKLVEWCSRLYAMSENDDELRKLIASSLAYIFPNQDADDLKKYSLQCLSAIKGSLAAL